MQEKHHSEGLNMEMNRELQLSLEKIQGEVRSFIDSHLVGNNEITELLYRSMRYSALADGKRIRPWLCASCADALGGDHQIAVAAGSALELVHTYSLVHDDLPAMDNDEMRRGQPTNHMVFGDAMAILTGDALLTMAFEWLCKLELPAERLIQLIRVLAEAAGHNGMVGGQMLDISEHLDAPPEKILVQTHAMKTAALINAACQMGVIISGRTELLSNFSDYGYNIGMLFQVVDDILDVQSSSEELGKTAGKDAIQDKHTYVSMYGIDGAQKLAEEYQLSAQKAIADVPNSGLLQEFSRYLLIRRK